MSFPKISVIIPTYNRASYLDQTISSVLSQKNAAFEVIISDNCSQDNTEDVVKKYLSDSRVKYFKNSVNVGMVKNWREAVYKRTNAEWFIILSDDDYFINDNYLENVIDYINSGENVVLVYGEGLILDETTKKTTFLSLPFDGVVSGVDVFMSRGTIKPQDATLCNMVFNKKIAIQLDAFSNPDNLSCDSELYLKTALLGNVAVIKGENSVYRFHPGNLVKTISSSAPLRLGNLDFIFSTYNFAKEKISSNQLRIFLNNINAVKAIQGCLLNMACIDKDEYLKCKNNLFDKNSYLVDLATNANSFKIKLFMINKFSALLPIYFYVRRALK
ncbi:glycosyltransferase family 2 protein [Janthinobacterium sp.]|uniref:glycosyltransferase family 2 protein n=1 Tax=Janthinobacterium sp. TaxID=1871054 RepID=UPI00289EF197|nr:glycosyltransferase family 2 protein [Janthinobacterium sp.]